MAITENPTEPSDPSRSVNLGRVTENPQDGIGAEAIGRRIAPCNHLEGSKTPRERAGGPSRKCP